MLTNQDIQAAVERVANAVVGPCQVIVFGSYATGQANSDSDLDLLVVEPSLKEKSAEYLRLRQAAGRIARGVGLDLLVCSEEEFERRSQVPGTLLYWARKEGVVAYDRRH